MTLIMPVSCIHIFKFTDCVTSTNGNLKKVKFHIFNRTVIPSLQKLAWYQSISNILINWVTVCWMDTNHCFQVTDSYTDCWFVYRALYYLTNIKTTNQNNIKICIPHPATCLGDCLLLYWWDFYSDLCASIFATIFMFQFQCPKSANLKQSFQNSCQIRQPIWFYLAETRTTVIWVFKLLVPFTKDKMPQICINILVVTNN